MVESMPGAGSVLRRVAALMAIVVVCQACLDGTWADGLWQSSDSEVLKIPELHEEFEGHIAVAMGQYGKDVAGILLLYTDGFSKTYLFDKCACMYLESAQTSGNSLSFRVQNCSGQTVFGAFEALDTDSPEKLEGWFYLDGQEAEEGSRVSLEFAGDENTIIEQELDQGCPAE